ncbi:unnamed protein product [Cylicocyclus nassatus]|uniref:Uncharacterized protein n=1 Tax=Cylicocyclus nassatus TaxID=53992 RepID=A0AA36HGS7_CYLNA|nr:unnamed protein product [Cylicocyclus nassatus]
MEGAIYYSILSISYHAAFPRWWLSLAVDDDGREKLFNVLSEKRVVWNGHARIAIGRALADIRTYHFDPERSALPPSKNVSSSKTLKAGVPVPLRKTECIEDKVEDIEEA